jgi:proteasome accessory factor C
VSQRQADLDRILTLVPVVAKNPGITVTELARRFACGPAEIRQDLGRVLLCGVPPYLPNDFVLVDYEGDRVFLDFADDFARPLTLLVEEGIALKLALERLEAAGAGPSVTELRRKVAAVLAHRDQEAGEAALRVEVTGEDRLGERVRLLMAAVREGRKVEIVYYTASRDATSRRIIWPRQIVERDGLLYLDAHCALRERVRKFRIDRIREARLGPRSAPPDATSGSPSDPPRTDVVIAFQPRVARFVAEQFTGLEDGHSDGRVRLRLHTEHPEWIFAWLLTFGGDAEIETPVWMRREYVRRLDGIIARHG